MNTKGISKITLVLMTIGLFALGIIGYVAVTKTLGVSISKNRMARDAGTVLPMEHISPTTSPIATLTVEKLLYKDPSLGFSLRYPNNAEARKENLEGYMNITREGVVGIFFPVSLFTGTNLSEAAVLVGVSNESDVLARCEKTNADTEETGTGTATIENVVFHTFEVNGAAAGNIYETKIFRVIHGGICYEIIELLHSGNIDNYDLGTAKEFNKPKFFDMLDAITNSFRFTAP